MYKRGDVFWADLSPVIGSEQDGVRPVVILQNDIGNRYSPTVIVAPLIFGCVVGTDKDNRQSTTGEFCWCNG